MTINNKNDLNKLAKRRVNMANTKRTMTEKSKEFLGEIWKDGAFAEWEVEMLSGLGAHTLRRTHHFREEFGPRPTGAFVATAS